MLTAQKGVHDCLPVAMANTIFGSTWKRVHFINIQDSFMVLKPLFLLSFANSHAQRYGARNESMSLMHKIARKFIGAFSEKQEVVADDFEFEHFLVYHGLIGTSPPGARQFKDVRADIRLAASSESYDQLAIALKVPPLY
ncbi:MAG: hypothetical protein K8F91_16035, partial [Candidatus Obscuribacterales bacterium]|nr:hypothetical protein [Candidatus Obscuribacterales bacterium]